MARSTRGKSYRRGAAATGDAYIRPLEGAPRGTGIEIDPSLVARSNANAQAAGVSGRTRFLAQDLFDADLSGASVITMYLLPEVNLKLRPRLLAVLGRTDQPQLVLRMGYGTEVKPTPRRPVSEVLS